MWIEIMRTGRHTATNGMGQEFTAGDLDRIAASYDPGYHEAPVVIGHPRDNLPAYGWVAALKREGQTLFAEIKQMVPEFMDWVKRGLFKKRSISLYPDLNGKGPYLRHVGFLGALPPAVKGLADINLRDGATSMTIEFTEGGKKARERLQERILNLMDNPPATDRYGNERRAPLSYSEAFSIATMENPQLAQDYAEELGVAQSYETQL